MHVGHMLKMCKEEFDRLMETSPSINEKIIKLFNNTFPTRKPIKNIDPLHETNDIRRPEICDSLVSTADFVFIPKPDVKPSTPSLANVIKNNQKKIMESYEKEVKDWCDKFINKHNRNPLESEIFDNLQDKMNPDILNKIIKTILVSYKQDSHFEIV